MITEESQSSHFPDKMTSKLSAWLSKCHQNQFISRCPAYIRRQLTSIGANTSVDSNDVQKFENLSGDWWLPNGPMKALHSLNDIRVPFIRDGLISTNVARPAFANTSRPLKDCKILEVGCGAGILTEQLARIHATVTGIDPGQSVINVAKEHANLSQNIAERITYLNENIEDHSTQNRDKYDAVIVSEVLEHVIEKAQFLEACLLTLKPGGSIFITTFDKTGFSWFSAIFVAETVTNLVPAGTHNWDNFIPPLDCQRLLDEFGCRTILCNGFLYEFWRNSWRWTSSTRMSYALQAVKEIRQ